MATPRRASLLLPLALLGATCRRARPFLLAALALCLATVCVWSTSDPSRFTIAPLCLLAPVASLQLAQWRRRLAAGHRWVLAALVLVWVGTLAYAAAREARKRSPTLDRIDASSLPRDPWGRGLLGWPEDP